jgi:hypothetical protein
MEEAKSGLLTYFPDHIITQAFLGDFEEIVAKVYSKWTLYDTQDEFYSACLAKLVKALGYYEGDKGAISTFIYRVVSNEAQRLYSLYRRMSQNEVIENQNGDTSDDKPNAEVGAVNHKPIDFDEGLREKLYDFAMKAYHIGVYINQKVLCRDYLEGNLTPVVKAFLWGEGNEG